MQGSQGGPPAGASGSPSPLPIGLAPLSGGGVSLAACKPGPGVQQKDGEECASGGRPSLVLSVPACSSAFVPVQDRLLVTSTLGAQGKATNSCEAADLQGEWRLGLSVLLFLVDRVG